MPTFDRGGISLHWLDLATLFAVASTMGLVFWHRMREHALIPVGDPRLEQALEFQNA